MRFFFAVIMAWSYVALVATAVCPNPRVRKSWGAMTADEQNLYVEAVGYGMRRGYHILFTELHSETQSSTEAYRTCGFLYWNRRFLLAYENMLRSLGTKYECVTIPYWDYFADYARFLVGNCDGGGSSIESCSPILRGLGGSSGTPRDVTINGQTISGNCVTTSPSNYFCESSTLSMNRTQCALCIPRSDWSSKAFPSGFGYAGLAVLLSQSNGFRQFSNAIQYGIHNSIHNTLSSTMATFMGPADPIFLSHHATIDMLHQTYLECRLGSEVKATSEDISRFAFQQCSYSGEACPTATSTVTQLWKRSDNVPPATVAVPAEKKGSLWRFFSPVPNQYWQLVSTKDLGAQSYSYELDDLMLNLQGNGFVCPQLAQDTTPTPTPSPTPIPEATNGTIANTTAPSTSPPAPSSTSITATLSPSQTTATPATATPVDTFTSPATPSISPLATLVPIEPPVSTPMSIPTPTGSISTRRSLRKRTRASMLDFSSTDGSEDSSSEEGDDEVSFSDLGDASEQPASTVVPSEEGEDEIVFSDLVAESGSSYSTIAEVESSIGFVSAPDLTLKAPASGFNDDYETAQTERQQMQKQSEGFLEAAVAVAVEVDGTLMTAYEQTELMECQLHQNIAGVDDFSDLFRKKFGLKDGAHTRCYELLRIGNACEEATAGDQKIEVDDWQQLAGQFYNRRRRREGP